MEIQDSKKAISQLAKVEKEDYGFSEELKSEIINILKQYYLNIIINNKNEYIEIIDINEDTIELNKDEIIKILENEKIERTSVYDRENNSKYINIYHYIAKLYEQEIKKMNNILDGISRLSTKDNHLSIIEEVERRNKNPNSLTVDIYDLKDEIFTIKKIFLKHIVNRIYEKKELKRRNKVYDIKGNVHIINPNELTIFNILMEISPLGEILLNDDNKFTYEYDIKNNKHLVKQSKDIFNQSFIDLSFSRNHSIELPKYQNLQNSFIQNSERNRVFVLLFDTNNQKYFIPIEQIKFIYEKLLNSENIQNIIQFTDYKGEIINLNYLDLRNKKTRFLVSSTSSNTYFIKDEDNISFFYLTNCLTGKSSIFPISTINKIINENKEKEYTEIEKDYTVCLEELKEVLNSGRENEYIKLKNISEVECYIKKNFILNYLNKLITNYIVNDIEKLTDIKGNIQYINMKKILSEMIEITPCPLYNDNILLKNDETYIFYKGGMKLQRQIVNKESELFQFLEIEDVKKEKFFIRKPACRNIIFTYKNNGLKIPNGIELTDLNNKRRRIDFKKYYQNYLKNSFKYKGIKIIFLINEIYVEVYDDINMKKYLVKKSKLAKLKSGQENISMNNYKNEVVNITQEMFSKVNLKKEWICIKDNKINDIYVYKSIIKGYIRDKLNGFLFKKILNSARESKFEDIYDYNCEKKRVNPIEIISNYTFQRTKNEKGEDIIEIINKN